MRGSGAFCDIERCLFYLLSEKSTFRVDLVRPESSVSNVLTVKPACEGSGGVIRSENVDMSSDKECERHSRRKSKGSCLKLI